MHTCKECSYSTYHKSHYDKHLKTKKHLMLVPSLAGAIQASGCSDVTHPEDPPSVIQLNCLNCGSKFTNKQNLKRHIRERCKKQDYRVISLKRRNGLKVPFLALKLAKHNENDINHNTFDPSLLDDLDFELDEGYRTLLSSPDTSPALMNELVKTIFSQYENKIGELEKIVNRYKSVVNQDLSTHHSNSHNNNHSNNTNNIQNNSYKECQFININYLNQNFGQIPGLNSFLGELQGNSKITLSEANTLLISHQRSGITSYGNYLAGLLKDKYLATLERDQIEYLPNTKPFPVALTDSNLRSHIQKIKEVWEKSISDSDLHSMINIVNDQVFVLTGQAVYLTDKHRKRVCTIIKKANDNNNFISDNQLDHEELNNNKIALTEEQIASWQIPNDEKDYIIHTLKRN